MKLRQLFVVITLVTTILACNLPASPASNESSTTTPNILSVTVDPPAGKRDFTLAVKYSVEWVQGKDIAGISCQYIAPDGTAMMIGMLDMKSHIGIKTIETHTRTLPFSVAAKNGKIDSGTYQAICVIEDQGKTTPTPGDNSKVRATSFEVTGEATSTPTIARSLSPTLTRTPTLTATRTASPTPSLTPRPQPTLLKGRIIFDYAKAQSSRPGAGGEASQVTNLCIPEVTFAIGGPVNGTCEKLNTRGHLVSEANVTVLVAGSVDASGKITFTYEVSEIGDPNGIWRVNYSASGTITPDNQASGTANFAYSCQSGSEYRLWCSLYLPHSTPSETFTGTIPWKFEPVK